MLRGLSLRLQQSKAPQENGVVLGFRSVESSTRKPSEFELKVRVCVVVQFVCVLCVFLEVCVQFGKRMQ